MSTIAQAKLDFANVLTGTNWALAERELAVAQRQLALAAGILWQFRRHPDYAKALRKVWDTATDLKTTPDGKVLDGILCDKTQEWLDRADQEFIDKIIRNGG